MIQIIYIYVVTIILFIIVWFMPKRMHTKDMYIIWLSVSFVEIVTDLILGHLMGLYYFAGENRISPEALGVKLIMASLFGIIYLNYMPKAFSHFMVYWIMWIIFATFFEWTTALSGYITYEEWKLWYSSIFYLFILPLTRWHYFYIKH